MYDVQFMDMAYEDYDAIYEYLSQFYPSTPEKFLAELEKSTATLEHSPYAFEVYAPVPQYRRMVVQNYLVFYKVFEESRKVEIHRILHGARNIQSILR